MLLVIDNYDSFTHNLVHMLLIAGVACRVVRNDAISVDEALSYDGAVLSPGPARPEAAGICIDLIRAAPPPWPVLGVCLGHQALGAAYGAHIIQVPPLHGMTSDITHTGTGLFDDLPTPLCVARYHSLAVEAATLPACLHITAQTADGVIMGLQHRDKNQYGVQFHPESIATPDGHGLIKNFLDRLALT